MHGTLSHKRLETGASAVFAGSTWMQAVLHIRAYGPMTALALAEELGWPKTKAFQACYRGHENFLLRRIGKLGSRGFVYAAVQTTEWPGRG